jgi:cytochrome c oxidase subunit II
MLLPANSTNVSTRGFIPLSKGEVRLTWYSGALRLFQSARQQGAKATLLKVWAVASLCSIAWAQAWPYGTPSALEPKGRNSAFVEGIWWYLFITATLVFVVVMVLMVIGLLRRGRSATHGEATNDQRLKPLFIFGSIVTALILILTVGFTFRAFNVLSSPAGDSRLTFEVIGKQFWWEIRYNGVAISANELRIPVGETVRLELRSDNVIHSFWVPQLTYKRDTMPGEENTLTIHADEAGVYRGLCAEFCGVQHGKMMFVVVAEETEDFDVWLENARADAVQVSDDAALAGRAVFANVGCAGCHAVRGTEAQGQLGPDLTHIGSRLTLGAAIMPNTRGHLGGWIVNPQAHKPGNYMPAQNLSSTDLQSLLTYLEQLK